MQIIEYNNNLNLENKVIIGIDEVGVGDYFGPLVGAVVSIPVANREKLIKLGIKDSKKIRNSKIKFFASQIKQLTQWSIYVLSPKGYNNLSSYNNANELKMFVHLNALNSLLKQNINYDAVFIDKYSTTRSIEKYFTKFYADNFFISFNKIAKPVILASKAENISLEVACASILAREKFIHKMEQMNLLYKIKFPFGASNKVKLFAKQLWNTRPDINKIEVCKNSFKMDIKN
ncbi:ribonuclease HIII [Mycoplasmopsis phocirhinis]|uniref:Ribonuclease n=1 Tax=Mycoplasmopsis phocirhinis TaxID=142650 RepID=A0A4P6MSX6_9BACT|nr:ribonuclease HIII [Mycoplasmopsis phocirhinis]QBF34804.1 ribonuclease HIII [Mycoplasmopsis phocirhinis]